MRRFFLITIMVALLLGGGTAVSAYASPKHKDKHHKVFCKHDNGKKKGHYKNGKRPVLVPPTHHHRHDHYVIGHKYKSCPHNSIVVNFNNTNYHYGDGFYFIKRALEYEIVRPPIGLTISLLPVGCPTIHDSRGTLYVHNSVLYKREVKKGKVRYKVVGFRD